MGDSHINRQCSKGRYLSVQGVDAGRESLLFLRYRPARLQGGEVLGEENQRDSIGRDQGSKAGPGRAGRGASLAHFPRAEEA